MRGDLLFFTPANPVERVIAAATSGPYCHVAVDMGDGTVTEATYTGVHRRPPRPGGRLHALALPDLPAGLAFLAPLVGRRYGFLDVAAVAARLLGYRGPVLLDPDAYDCSDLATRFLTAAGYPLGPLADHPELVSPNDLARALHHK